MGNFLFITGKLCEVDIDECSSSPCDNKATCMDLPGGFTCMCPQGFTGPDCNDIGNHKCMKTFITVFIYYGHIFEPKKLFTYMY